ncbi:hypothetical protein SAY87_005980 [Trapa incisa]|uniref:Centromere protein C n=1 Tax=Trapa incisa TaxID=236973 RepID=A0AAN7Q7Y9_9MYRT|nr:hypothetical protein SAY87_005980 [Trapa incisa]
MACGAAGSDPVNALAQFSVLSLFPHSFEVLQNVADPYNLERELDFLHSHLGTIALQSPKKILNQAEAVVENFSEPFITNDTSQAAAEAPCEFDVSKANKNPKIRRPGLGHKPAKFSLKFGSSQPAVNLGDAFDIDSYDDPDEYFAAYERFERAKRELMRQNGITVLGDQGSYSVKERPRRPGLPGRSYKNRFSESGIFPAETVMEKHIAVSNSSEEQYATTELNDDSQEMDVTGSIKVKRRNDEILDNLLSQNLDVLDGEGAVNILHDHLKIKPIDIQILCLPELKDIQKDDLNTLSRKILKQRPALFNIQNLMKETDRHSPTKPRGGSESFKSHLSLQSSRKSHFSQMASLKKRLFIEDTSLDSFSPAHADEVDIRRLYDSQQSERHSDDVDNRNKLGIPLNLPDESVCVPLDTQDLDNDIILDPAHADEVDIRKPHDAQHSERHSDDVDKRNKFGIPLNLPDESVCVPLDAQDLDNEIILDPAHADEIDIRKPHDTQHSDRHSDDVNKRNTFGIPLNLPDESVCLALDTQDLDNEIILDPSHDMQNRAGNCCATLPMVFECSERSINDLDGHVENESAMPMQINTKIGDSNVEPDDEDVAFLDPLIFSIVEESAENSSSKCDKGVLEHHMEEFSAAASNRRSEIRLRPLHEACTSKEASNGKSASDESVSVPMDTQDLDNEISLDSHHDMHNGIGNCIRISPIMFECSGRSSNDADAHTEMEAAMPARINNKIVALNVEPAYEDVAFLGPLVSEEYAGNGSSKCADDVLENHMEETRAASPNRQTEITSRHLHEGQRRKQASNGKSVSVPEDPVMVDCQPLKRANIAPDESIEEAPKETNNGERKRSRTHKENLKHRRTSLADAGMAWTNGIRRSTRIRSRPLAFWKGERFLYGRIHQSLATVIGMKYESPGKTDGKPGLKVKSFVSDEYKELLDFVA